MWNKLTWERFGFAFCGVRLLSKPAPGRLPSGPPPEKDESSAREKKQGHLVKDAIKKKKHIGRDNLRVFVVAPKDPGGND